VLEKKFPWLEQLNELSLSVEEVEAGRPPDPPYVPPYPSDAGPGPDTDPGPPAGPLPLVLMFPWIATEELPVMFTLLACNTTIHKSHHTQQKRSDIFIPLHQSKYLY